ncbi:MAG: sulfotransferase family 2 domain-containing protein, partial [Saprospiraceae bacterium]|nr:sulfotransferase family 2 domain-containing protein [Saprospiraceae bacterium]
MISHTHQFIFVHINKTGGTSIEKVFIDTADQADVRFKHKDVAFYQRRFPEVFERYFKFAFVRNPWDWLVSRYTWSRYHQSLLAISFTEMIERLDCGVELAPDVPWFRRALAPQSERLMIDGRIAVDFVGKFESLQSDFDVVCDR